MLSLHTCIFFRPSLWHIDTKPNRKGDQVELEALEELLRSWVAFSVVDEDGAGSVSVGDLKARQFHTSVVWVVLFSRQGFQCIRLLLQE